MCIMDFDKLNLVKLNYGGLIFWLEPIFSKASLKPIGQGFLETNSQKQEYEILVEYHGEEMGLTIQNIHDVIFRRLS